MLMHVAGGVGEHGRNCFAVLGKNVHFLVDCGIMHGEVPKLTRDEISILDFVLLTHSHGDHTGALGWLAQKGYKGPVIASKKTLEQLDALDNSIALEDVCPKGHGMWTSIGEEAGIVKAVCIILWKQRERRSASAATTVKIP